jgi:hypothetical protein
MSVNAVRRLAKSLVLVAGAMALAAWSRAGHADAPPGRYVIQDTGTPTGTVSDTFTKLTWQQVASTSTYTWSDAQTYCSSNPAGLPGTGWRAASLNELQTIVDETRNPALDPTAFPSAPSSRIWTSTPAPPASSSTPVAYYVDFVDYGSVNYDYVSTTYSVRCVR